MKTSIGWILIASGAVTAAGGLAALLGPRALLRLAFGVEAVDRSTMFFVLHWGVLIFVMGVLILHAGYDSAGRAPVLMAAAVEKLAIVLLLFWGPIKRTIAMTAIALADGAFALIYVAYLAGL